MTAATTKPIAEPVHKPREVAAHLGIDLDSLYALIHAGHLRAVRVGRIWRIPQSSLDRFLAGR